MITLPDPIIIGFMGFANVGKDYTANELSAYLQLNHDITTVILHFADALKAIVHRIYPDLSHDKTLPETRETYQAIGSLLRHYLGPEVFVNALHASIYDSTEEYPYFYLIPDVRYPEEINYILNQSPHNHIFHVTKKGHKPVNTHISEMAHTAALLSTGRYFNPNVHALPNDTSEGHDAIFEEVLGNFLRENRKVD